MYSLRAQLSCRKGISYDQLFSLAAQKAGFEVHASAEADGLGITANTGDGPTRVHSVDAAIRVARDYVGQFIEPARRGGIPWGLLVTVSEGVASYGEWPLSGGGGSPSFQQTALVRIRQRWQDHSPLSALENAVESSTGTTAAHPTVDKRRKHGNESFSWRAILTLSSRVAPAPAGFAAERGHRIDPAYGVEQVRSFMVAKRDPPLIGRVCAASITRCATGVVGCVATTRRRCDDALLSSAE